MRFGLLLYHLMTFKTVCDWFAGPRAPSPSLLLPTRCNSNGDNCKWNNCILVQALSAVFNNISSSLFALLQVCRSWGQSCSVMFWVKLLTYTHQIRFQLTIVHGCDVSMSHGDWCKPNSHVASQWEMSKPGRFTFDPFLIVKLLLLAKTAIAN